MNVCMLLYTYWPQQVGGAETQCRRLTHALADKGVNSIVITARCKMEVPKREKDGKVLIVRCFVFQLIIESVFSAFKKKSLQKNNVNSEKCVNDTKNETASSHRRYVVFFEQAVNWLNSLFFIIGTSWICCFRRKQIDIIHVHSTEWIAGLAVFIGKFLKIPVVCKETSSPAFLAATAAVPFGRFLDKYRFRGNYIVLTAAVKEQMLRLGIDEKKIFLIPNGVSIPDMTAAVSRSNYVLWIGNFSQGIHVKGIDILLNAWTGVQKYKPDARLLMIGGGDVSFVMREAQQKNIADSIEIAGYSNRVEEYYQRAALFALPSRTEGMSNTLLEAHAWGIPSVASDIPANQAVVLEGETGFLVPVQESSLFAERIIHLLNDRILSERIGKKAREHALRNFSIDSTAEQLYACYKTVRERHL